MVMSFEESDVAVSVSATGLKGEAGSGATVSLGAEMSQVLRGLARLSNRYHGSQPESYNL